MSSPTDTPRGTTPRKAKAAPRKRVPAEERREDVLAVAAEVVARDGMHAAGTAEIAKRAGISHAYLFRLFPTKEELLLAVAREACARMRREMVEAGEVARAAGEDPLVAMGLRWMQLLEDRTLLQVSLQSISAARSMPVLGEQLREAWELIVTDIERIAAPEADRDAVRAFIAEGMLLKIIGGLGAEESPWVVRLHDGPLPCTPERMQEGIDESIRQKT